MKIFAKPLFTNNKDEREFAARQKESQRRSEQMTAALSDLDLDTLPEAADADNDLGTTEIAAAEISPDATVATVTDEVLTDDTYVLDSTDDFELEGAYIASASSNPNYITLFDTLGNVVYDGTRETALAEFTALSPEELAGIYGSGESALSAGLAAIEVLVSEDETGLAQNLIEKNSALYSSYTAYLNPVTPSRISGDALTMLY